MGQIFVIRLSSGFIYAPRSCHQAVSRVRDRGHSEGAKQSNERKAKQNIALCPDDLVVKILTSPGPWTGFCVSSLLTSCFLFILVEALQQYYTFLFKKPL